MPPALTPAQIRRQLGFLALGIAALVGGVTMRAETASWFAPTQARPGPAAPAGPARAAAVRSLPGAALPPVPVPERVTQPARP